MSPVLALLCPQSSVIRPLPAAYCLLLTAYCHRPSALRRLSSVICHLAHGPILAQDDSLLIHAMARNARGKTPFPYFVHRSEQSGLLNTRVTYVMVRDT